VESAPLAWNPRVVAAIPRCRLRSPSTAEASSGSAASCRSRRCRMIPWRARVASTTKASPAASAASRPSTLSRQAPSKSVKNRPTADRVRHRARSGSSPCSVAISRARWAASYSRPNGLAVSATSAMPVSRRPWSRERSWGARRMARRRKSMPSGPCPCRCHSQGSAAARRRPGSGSGAASPHSRAVRRFACSSSSRVRQASRSRRSSGSTPSTKARTWARWRSRVAATSPASGQPVGGELPDRLQQPVAGLLAALAGHDQGLVDQPPQGVEHVVAADGPGGGHRAGRLQAEPAGEGG
jgi:hypothetical protein